LAFRIFDRKQIYQDLKTRLLNNLVLACKVAERDGLAILNKYKSIESYFGAKRRVGQQRQLQKEHAIIQRQSRELRIPGASPERVEEGESFRVSRVNE
jgi:hypothetical protein